MIWWVLYVEVSHIKWLCDKCFCARVVVVQSQKNCVEGSLSVDIVLT